MNEKQVNAVISELEQQRNILGARCTQYVSEVVALQEMMQAKDKRLAELEDEVKALKESIVQQDEAKPE